VNSRRVYTRPALGEVAESAEGSRLLSGYRVKSSVPGSNPGLSAKYSRSGSNSANLLTIVHRSLVLLLQNIATGRGTGCHDGFQLEHRPSRSGLPLA
jgi:hypothetical protein